MSSAPAFEELSADALRARDCYRLMTDLIAPRPIAWVSTVDASGVANLAPFSYYQGVCSDPPTLVLGLGWRPDGRPKDTLANVLATRELTISHVSEALADKMNASSADYPPEVEEWQACAIARAPARVVAPPRVAEARAGFECRLRQAIPLGETRHGTPSATLVIAEIVHLWLAPGLIERDERGWLRPINPAALGAVGRLGGISYAHTGETFELPRPPKPDSD